MADVALFCCNNGTSCEADREKATGDCVVRAICIAAEKPYNVVCMDLDNAIKKSGPILYRRENPSAKDGVHIETAKWYMRRIGWNWVYTEHKKPNDIFDKFVKGRFVVVIANDNGGHATAIIDGVVHDLWNCFLDASCLVRGYFYKAES